MLLRRLTAIVDADIGTRLAQHQRLFDKLLEKDRDARFRNADEVIGYLTRKFAP